MVVDENGVECMLEEVLSIAVTEAVCERYFRICSTIVKKPSVTKMNDMAFILYCSKYRFATHKRKGYV